MKPPSLLIISGYRKLAAYVILPDGLPETAETIDYENDGQTSVPLVDWTDGGRCYGEVAGQITGILQRYQPETWGLAGEADLVEKTTRLLAPDILNSLAIVRYTDPETVSISNVCSVFDAATNGAAVEKEHCF